MVFLMATQRFSRRIFARAACGILVLFAGYTFSVGAVPAMLRHTGDSGRLQWLPRCPGAIALLEAYEWPAEQMSRVPLLRRVFECSAAHWWELLNPPDTTA